MSKPWKRQQVATPVPFAKMSHKLTYIEETRAVGRHDKLFRKMTCIYSMFPQSVI